MIAIAITSIIFKIAETLILDANAANTKQLSEPEKLTGLLRNRPQDIGHRPFSSSPGPLYQSKVRCSAFRHLLISHNAPYFPVASIFALTTIALERLYAVMWPLKNMVTSKRVYYFVISIVWFLSALVALLYFMNDGFKVFKLRVFFYFVIFFISSSLLIICVAYVLIWKKVTLQKDDSPRQGSKYQEEMEQRKRRTQEKSLVTTLLILSLVFVLTWVPFYVLNIVVFFYAKREPMDIPFEAFCFTKLLHYSNSLANPIVYSIRIPRFARSLLGFFRKRKSALMVSLRLSIKR